MNEFIMMVGLPRSGKSTKAAEYTSKGYTVVSVLRAKKRLREICDDARKPYEVCEEMISDAISRGENVVYDSDNLNARIREKILSTIPSTYKKICIFVATSVEDCISRSNKRDPEIHKKFVDRAMTMIDIPYYFEGWDEIRVELGRECGVTPDGLVNSLMGISQESKNHKMGLGEHCVGAYQYAKAHGFNPFVRYAALLHDVGKPETKGYLNKDGNEDGKAHYYNHQNVGAYKSLFLDYPEDMTIDNILHVCALIGYHMVPYTFGKRGRERAKERFGEDFFNEIMSLHECDIRAR